VGYLQLRREQIVNHFQGNGEITTKGLLCRNMRNCSWVADVDHELLFPRSFNVFADTEWEAFVQSFYLTGTQCNTLQHNATRCNTLQHTATCGNTVQHAA